MGHLCISDSVPSSVDQSLHLFPTASNASLLSQLISPSERGFPFQRGGFPYFGISPLLQLPCLRVQVLSRFLSSSFSLLFFHPTQLCRGLYSPFWCPRSSASVQPVVCENCCIYRCIPDASVERGELHVLLLLRQLP